MRATQLRSFTGHTKKLIRRRQRCVLRRAHSSSAGAEASVNCSRYRRCQPISTVIDCSVRPINASADTRRGVYPVASRVGVTSSVSTYELTAFLDGSACIPRALTESSECMHAEVAAIPRFQFRVRLAQSDDPTFPRCCAQTAANRPRTANLGARATIDRRLAVACLYRS